MLSVREREKKKIEKPNSCWSSHKSRVAVALVNAKRRALDPLHPSPPAPLLSSRGRSIPLSPLPHPHLLQPCPNWWFGAFGGRLCSDVAALKGRVWVTFSFQLFRSFAHSFIRFCPNIKNNIFTLPNANRKTTQVTATATAAAMPTNSPNTHSHHTHNANIMHTLHI